MSKYRKFLSLLLSLMMLVTALPLGEITVSAENTTEFFGGDGTKKNPYLISTKEHLNNVRNYLDAHFLMVTDIVFTDADFAEGGQFYNDGQGWEPIGTDYKSTFAGVFDGGGHEIIGLQCTRSGSSRVYAGLFGFNTGTVQNLGMVDSYITGTTTSASWTPYVGGIIGYHDGVAITNCYNTGSVSIPSAARADTFAYAGGIVGYSRGTISGCHNAGRISSELETSYSYVGGIAGYTIGTVRQCHNTGTVQNVANATWAYAGGITGYGIGNISGCDNVGMVLATPPANSLVCSAGGIVGSGNQISRCHNTGVVHSNSYAGGIAGENRSDINDSYNTGSIQAKLPGGIAGKNSGLISICYNTGNVFTSTSVSTPYVAGGIASFNEGGTIEDCYNTGSITSARAGGIVGDLDKGTISRCYNVGMILPFRGSIQLCLGGILGCNFGGTVQHSYYLDTAVQTEITGSAQGVACTEEQMKQQGTFVDFNFHSVWEIDSYHNYPYPQLKNNRQETIQSIEFLTKPDNHFQVIEGLLPELLGVTVKIIYEDGFEITTEATTQMLSELNVNQLGVQTIHLNYGGQTTAETIDIEIIPKSIASIAVTTPPTKITYVQGQPLNPSGGRLTIYYNNNTSETVDLSAAQLFYIADQPGEATATATYQGFEANFTITVTERVIKSISLIEPTKLSYVEGQELDLTGGKIQITYVSDDNYTERIPLELDMITGFDNTQVGNQTLTVTYGGKEATFEISVIPAAPSAPTLSEKTDTTVTLKSVAGYEYRMDNGEWQMSNVFTGLAPNSTHQFYQRVAETSTSYASDSSPALSVITNKSQSVAPNAPTLHDKTATTVTLTATAGYEYSKDGVTWQDSPTFVGLKPDTEYRFYQRVKETDTHYASPISTALTVKTNPEYVKGDLSGDNIVTDADAIYLLYHTLLPDLYPINQSADYNGDGKVTDADAIYLLYYTLLPDLYPLH